MRRTRLATLLVAVAAAALLLSGCVWLKEGSVALTQPGGIGPIQLRFALCTTVVSEEGKVSCGAGSTATEGQVFVGLVVPTGTQAPETLTVTPGPGAGPLTLTRSAAVASALSANPVLAETGTVVPPPGSEILGYASGTIAEPAGQTLEWTVSTSLGLPPVADGGSYGGPLRVAVLPASREVTPERPAGRPFSCSTEGDLTTCGTTETAVELGTSDLKITAPASAVAPGAQVKVPFNLDFASSAAALPKFSLKASSTLPKAMLRLPSASFSRAPRNATTKRAPATTRKVIVDVPASARPGNYELALTAAAAPGGGTATGVATLTVTPPLKARLVAPRRVKASVASAKGIPVRVVMPVAGSRLVLRLLGQNPGGNGQAQLKKAVRKAKVAGPLRLRLKLPPAKALALLAADAKLTLKATISTPGLKPRKLTRTLRLR